MEPFLSFVLAHAGVFSGSAGALFATLLHSRLAKALAVDVAKAVLAAWDHPASPQTTKGVIDFRPFPPPSALLESMRENLGLPARDPSGNPVKPTPGS